MSTIILSLSLLFAPSITLELNELDLGSNQETPPLFEFTEDHIYVADFTNIQILSEVGDYQGSYSVADRFAGEASNPRIGSIAFLPDHFEGVVYVSVTGASLDGENYFFRGILLDRDGVELGTVYDPNLAPSGKREVRVAETASRDPKAVFFRNVYGLNSGLTMANTWSYGTIGNDQAIILRELEITHTPNSLYGAYKVKLGARFWSQHFGRDSSVAGNMGVLVEMTNDGRVMVLSRRDQNLHVFERSSAAERVSGKEGHWKKVGIRRWSLPGFTGQDPLRSPTAKVDNPTEIRGFHPVDDGFFVFYRGVKKTSTQLVKIGLDNKVNEERTIDGQFAGSGSDSAYFYTTEGAQHLLEEIRLNHFI